MLDCTKNVLEINFKFVYWGTNVNKTVWYKTWHDSCGKCMTLKKVNVLLEYILYFFQENSFKAYFQV